MTDKFHLSVVATARHDNHGGNFLYRMQHFVDGFIEQCKRHQLKAELIIVEWNPPEETCPLYQALKFPTDKGPCAIRFIRVPKEIHMKLDHADKIPLFQMIGKNVGIRRALGTYVLATNIDILFSDSVIQFLRDHLTPGLLYRTDRLDVPAELPPTHSMNELLDYCAQNYFRINGKYGTKIKINGKWELQFSFFNRLKKFLLGQSSGSPITKLYNLVKQLKMQVPKVHANACGDFTLLSYNDWANLRGYPEWEIFSWHLDSLLLHQAQYNTIKLVDLPQKMAIYHIEHGAGSGYTPEVHSVLFNRLKDKRIPFLKDSDLQENIFKMQKNKGKVIYNKENWGISDLSLEEIWI